MGYFSNVQVEEQNPSERFASGGRIERPQPDTDLIPIWVDSGYMIPVCDAVDSAARRKILEDATEGDYAHGGYVLNARQSEKYAPVLARINAGWHEGEGCSGNACCCDQIELDIE